MKKSGPRRRFGCRPVPARRPALERQRIASELKRLLGQLPGLATPASMDYFVEMLVLGEEWLREMRDLTRNPLPANRDPREKQWDARVAILHLDRSGNEEEATWLAFLCIVLGELDEEEPWKSVALLYTGFGTGQLRWESVAADPQIVNDLWTRYPDRVKALKFANHRKFESRASIPSVIASYVDVVRSFGGGSQVRWLGGGPDSPEKRFTRLFTQVKKVKRFDRLASYDFLILLGCLNVYALKPERLYLRDSSGPIQGAQRLFGHRGSPDLLDEKGSALAGQLCVSLQAMEDAMCNWQKQP